MAAISTSTYGSGQLVSLAMTGAPNLRSSHTIAVRVKHSTTSTSIDTTIAAYAGTSITYNPQGSAFGRNNGIASTGVNVYRINDSFFPTSDSATRSTCYGNTTTWYHLCLVYNASTQRIRFYIDGVYIGETASNTTRTSSVTSNSFGVAAHPGAFADAAFYDRALSDAEVTSLYNYRVPQVTSGLYLFWRLDSDASDGSGNGRDGATTGSGSSITYSTSDNPPQPETPTIAITASASSSTSGTASVIKTYSLGAVTGVSSTSGTAAVNVFPVAASTSSRAAGWADVIPSNNRRAYRFQQQKSSVINHVSDAGPATGGAPSTLMCWMRYYLPITQSGTGYRSSSVTLRGAGGASGGWTYDLRIFPDYADSIVNINGISQGQRFSAGTLSNDWHHVCGTYDGANYKLYIDGAQSGTDLAVVLPTDDTSLSIRVFSYELTAVDIAHMKAWIGIALDSTQIATEIANYRPVTSTANVRGYWPLLWDNPTWDAWSNTMTLPAVMVHSGDDAPNGPPGTWPPIGSVAGSTATSGTATVNVVNSASASTRSAGWADVMPRNGAEGYRFQDVALNVTGSSSGPTAGAPLTFMCWARTRFQPTPGGAVFGYGPGGLTLYGSGGTTWWIGLYAIASSFNQFYGNLYIGGALQSSTYTPTPQSSDWHHICGTYTGSVIRFYVDGVQVGADFATSLPTNDTGLSVRVLGSSGNVTDAAHAKAWIGIALNPTQIAAEMATYRPVTSTANVRGYWPLAWDNPRWDAWSNTMTLPAAMEWYGDDAPNGPSGTWPPIGSVAGSTATNGTAQVGLVRNLGACTGSTQSSGAATVIKLVNAAGSSQTSGSANVGIAYAFAVSGTGATQTSGTANVVVGKNGTGSTQTSGTAAVSSSASVAASGSTATAGSVIVNQRVVPTGSTQTSGTASVTAASALIASGSTTTGTSSAAAAAAAALAAAGSTTTGTSSATTSLNTAYNIPASGVTATSGTASLTVIAGLTAAGSTATAPSTGSFAGTIISTGATQSAGAASFDTASFPASALGSTATAGSAAVDAGLPQSADGEVSTSGSATVTSSTAVVATGVTATAGATRLTLVVGGLTSTSGAAQLTSSASVTAAGAASTNGTAAAVAQLVVLAGGLSNTSGSAAMTKSAAIAATGSCVTVGSAVFDGIAPPGGGGGGQQDYMRRGSAIAAGRRALR